MCSQTHLRCGTVGAAACLVAVLLVASVGPGRAAEVYLGLSRSAGAKIPIGMLGIHAATELGPQAAALRAIIESDLRRSLLFDVVALPASAPPTSSPNAARVKQAAASGVDAVVWGRLTRERDGGLLWDGSGFDGGSGALVVQKLYRGRDDTYLRSIAHKFADALVSAFTGEKGIAESRIAFVSDRTGKQEIYMMDYDGAQVTKITSDRSIALTPRWSPDGKLLTYVSYRDGRPALYSFIFASGRRWQVVGWPGLTMSPAWSPSGDRLAFASSREGSLDLYVADPDGKPLQRLTFGLGDDLSPSWSPTGRQIAYNSDQGGSAQIYVMNADGSDQRRLTFEGPYNTTPAFSPKGDWIAYTCRVDDRHQLCLTGPDGSRRVQVTDAPGNNEGPSWAPDGRHLVFASDREGSTNLYVIGIDGTGEERLTMDPGNHTMASWSPG